MNNYNLQPTFSIKSELYFSDELSQDPRWLDLSLEQIFQKMYSMRTLCWGGGWCSGPLPWPYRDMYDPLLLLLGQPTIKIWTNDQENISSRKDSFTKQISYFINHICPVKSDPLFSIWDKGNGKCPASWPQDLIARKTFSRPRKPSDSHSPSMMYYNTRFPWQNRFYYLISGRFYIADLNPSESNASCVAQPATSTARCPDLGRDLR